jgi:hypothetical protein
MFQIMSNIPNILLINLNGGPPVLSTSMRLNPKKKIQLHLETQQQIPRIKNCCGKMNKSCDFQIYFYVQNNCTKNTFYAEQHTLLTDILNNPLLSSYVRLCNPLKNVLYLYLKKLFYKKIKVILYNIYHKTIS